jgi:hypothetical protein
LRLTILFVLLTSFAVSAQTYEDYINRARDAIDTLAGTNISLNKEQYSFLAGLFDSAFAVGKPRGEDLYNAACSNAMIGRLPKATQYLRRAFENGYDNFDAMYYDRDLDPLRYDPEYLALEKKYRPDSVVFFFDILRQLNASDEVKICDRRVSLTEARLFRYSFAEMEYRTGLKLKLIGDSLIDFSNKNLEICRSKFDDTEDSFNSLERMSLGRLDIVDCWGNLELADIQTKALDFHASPGRENNLARVMFDNLIVNGDVRLGANGIEFECRNSTFNIEVPGAGGNRWGLVWDLDYDRMFVTNTEFNNAQKTGRLFPFEFQFIDVGRLRIDDSQFNHSTRMWGDVSDLLSVKNSTFPKYLDIIGLKLPDFDCYFPFSQLSNSRLVHFDFDYTHLFIQGDSTDKFTDEAFYENLTGLYKRYYDHYRDRADISSANKVYMLMKDLEIAHLKSKEDRSTEETMRLRLNQLMGFYTDHATSPGKALIISFYIILLFGIFYCFFPSDWDKTSKEKIVTDFRLFIEKNEHGYVKPFFKMMRGLLISLLNAVALSLNAFITLGFGNIPTTGIARYVCVLQGALGWFLLSLFTVALLNQVLL